MSKISQSKFAGKLDGNNIHGYFLDTTLHASMTNEFTECIKLLEQGADIDAANFKGNTPLHIQADRSNPHTLDVLKFLIERGAEVNATDRLGYTPLLYACFSNSPESAKLLIDMGADVNHVSIDGQSLLATVIKTITPSTTLRSDNTTNSRLALVDLLLTQGANVRAKNYTGETALHLISGTFCAHETDAAVANKLLEHGANINAIDNNGRTPLHHAARLGRMQVCEFLIGTGACRVDIMDKIGRMAIDDTRVSEMYQEHLAKVRSSDIAKSMGSVIDEAISVEVAVTPVRARRNRVL